MYDLEISRPLNARLLELAAQVGPHFLEDHHLARQIGEFVGKLRNVRQRDDNAAGG